MDPHFGRNCFQRRPPGITDTAGPPQDILRQSRMKENAMRVEQHLDEIARTQGWSDKTQLIHALTFLDKLVMQGAISADDFRAYLEQIRAEEIEVARRAEDSGT
jgi:hypothetical protein